MANGPVLVVFGLYDDMYYYAGGIYEVIEMSHYN
jgi:hypothetical protein